MARPARSGAITGLAVRKAATAAAVTDPTRGTVRGRVFTTRDGPAAAEAALEIAGRARVVAGRVAADPVAAAPREALGALAAGLAEGLRASALSVARPRAAAGASGIGS